MSDNIRETIMFDEHVQVTEEDNIIVWEIVKEIPSEWYVMGDTS